MTPEIQIGLIGLDSSHCVEYARLFHDQQHEQHVTGARIVAAYPGGSPDWELSYSRVEGFCDQVKNEFGVPLVGSIEELVAAADAIMILSVDGRTHLKEFEQVAQSGKPVYIDKPLSATLADAVRLHAIAQSTGTRLFSSSVWRFSRGLIEAKAALEGPCRLAHVHGHWPLHAGMHGWTYYGIHHVEMLYAVMGTGCLRVSCHRVGSTEVLIGFWPDGRVGTIATDHDEELPFGGWLLGEKGSSMMEVRDTKYHRYEAFLQAALKFFGGAAAPVPLRESIETIAFLEAAAQSAAQGGTSVDVMTPSL